MDSAEFDLTGTAEVWLPHRGRGKNPQALLSVVLGDYWWEREELVPVAALIAILDRFGVAENTARQTIWRLAERGILRKGKSGGAPAYGFHPRPKEVSFERTRRILAFGGPSDPWDGLWTIVTYTVNPKNRSERAVMNRRLLAAGFAQLEGTTWCTPLDRATEALALLDQHDGLHGSVVRGKMLRFSDEAGFLQRAFGLSEIAEKYRAFISRHESTASEPDDPLRNRTLLMSDWLGLRREDPRLPDALLPPEWPRSRAGEVFLRGYDELGPAASREFANELARFAPQLSKYVAYRTSEILQPSR